MFSLTPQSNQCYVSARVCYLCNLSLFKLASARKGYLGGEISLKYIPITATCLSPVLEDTWKGLLVETCLT